ncbi:MAG: SusC/RagA family TonB-linked outer membrane protein, partial [Prevotellaceae bacterium]|nr:SusC/RagA family TonB-linked outer membrane protein [Prevotellaceae bacterium]
MNMLKKLSTLCLFLGLSFGTFAAFVADATVTLKLDNAGVKEFFAKIEEQTDYSFLYKRGVVDNKTVSIDARDLPLEEALRRTLPKAGLEYAVKGNQIVVTEKAKAEQPAAENGETYVLKGVVLDSSGEPLVGASVTVKGTTSGIITDFDGKFSLKVTRGFTILVRFIGYQNEEILLTGQNDLKIVMNEDATTLKDVVVVGYGTQKKASVVGSVQTIRPSELKVPATSLSQSFAGRLAGVIAVQRTGEPGADGANFWIRGVSTTSGVTNPLIIIDGVQASQGDLNNIAPEMIESFSVLKDATATALYGTLGANGVMIVTTKSGDTSGKPKINVRVEQTFNSPLKVPSTVDGVRFMELFNEAHGYRGSTSQPYSADKIRYTAAGLDPLVYPNVDWYSEMFNELSTSQTANLNIQGGGAKADYYLGVNASHESGMIKNLSGDYYSFNNNIDLMKYVFQNNVNVNLTKTSKISLRLNVQLRDYTGPNKSASDLFTEVMQSNPVGAPVVWNPADPRLRNADGGAYVTPYYTMWGGTSMVDMINPNPIADLTKGVNTDFQSTVIATLVFDQKLDFLLPGLSANALVSFKNWSETTTYRAFNRLNLFYLDQLTMNGDAIDNYTIT